MKDINNIITGLLIVLMIVVIAGGGYFIYTQQNTPVDTAGLPTVAFVPTITPLPPTVDRPTLPPTFTPIPSITPTVPTATPRPSLTPVPSVTPTITDTPPATATPEQSDTPTPTLTFTPSETSSIPSATPTATRSPFPFAVRGGQAVFTQNVYNSQGCAFQAVSGQVLSEQGAGLNNIVVFVTEPGGAERAATSGTASAYGPGGYEIPVDDQINNRTYIVQLRTQSGIELSEPYALTFPSNCDQNIALIYWSQTRPF
jgi:hypothetical protein